MNSKLNHFFETIKPYLFVGISIAFMILAVIIFAYVLIWGLLIGAMIYLIAWIKMRFFPSEPQKQQKSQRKPRIIEHDDIK